MWHCDGCESALRMRAHPSPSWPPPGFCCAAAAAADQNPPYRSWHTHEAWQVSSGRSRSAFMWRSSAVMVSHTQQQLVYQTEMQFVGASSLCNSGNPLNARHLVQTTGEARYRPVHKHTIPFRPWHAVVFACFWDACSC